VRRLFAAVAIMLGTAVVGFSPNRWDVVVLDLPRGHGIHLHDMLGSALIALGIAVFWHISAET
jgi:hypothetical protein